MLTEEEYKELKKQLDQALFRHFIKYEMKSTDSPFGLQWFERKMFDFDCRCFLIDAEAKMIVDKHQRRR